MLRRQNVHTLPEHQRSFPVFVVVHVAQSLVFDIVLFFKHYLYFGILLFFHAVVSIFIYFRVRMYLFHITFSGCPKTMWGSYCSKTCPNTCIDQHCYPENGSCVWGCYCLNGICNEYTTECNDGCVENRTGKECGKCEEFQLYISKSYEA